MNILLILYLKTRVENLIEAKKLELFELKKKERKKEKKSQKEIIVLSIDLITRQVQL